MKYYFTITCLFTSLLVFYSTLLFAHKGGHYHKHDGSVLSTWHLKNGQTISGNFSKREGNSMWLEQYEGKLVMVSIQDLSEADRKTAYQKINKFSSLNTVQLSHANPAPNQFRYSFALLSIILAGIVILLAKQITVIYRKNIQLKWKAAWLSACLLVMLVSSYAFTETIEQVTIPIPKTTCTFIDSAFAPYKPAVTTRWDETYFYVSSNGLPAHNMMVGITNWQQQVPLPQMYTGDNSWSIPLQPVYADVPLSTRTNFMKGAVAIAVNGVPIFNALNNRGEDAFLTGELDNWGGHCGRADDYHYHAAPLHLSVTSGLKPIAFALDGFAVYGIREPDGAGMRALDSCHGHVGTNNVYHYHGTNIYPYVIGAMKGKVATDPKTPALGNQILPQAFARPLRPATTPLRGASITSFISTGTNAYKLTYQLGTQSGYVEYRWDPANKYTFIITDTEGRVSTAVYQR